MTMRVILLAALLGFPITLAAAQEVQDTLPRYELEGVTVTVTRLPALRTELSQRVDVLTREEIERTAAVDAVQLLRRNALADVIEYPGLLAGVGIRGFRPQFSGMNQRTLILVDGRPAGVSNLALLELRGVERVEVLRGPGSSLYGTSAMGGVVNVVTRRGGGAPRGGVTLAYGSWDTREAQVEAGGALGGGLDFDLSLAALARGSDYRVGGDGPLQMLLGDTVALRVWPDSAVASAERGAGERRPHTRYSTRSGALRLGYALAGGWRVDLRADRFVADRVENPGDLHAPWDGRTLKNVGRSSVDLALGGAVGRHALTLRGFTTAEEGESFNAPEPGEGVPHFVTLDSRIRWRGLQLQDAVTLGRHSLVAGVDVTRASSESERFAAPGERVGPWEPDARTHSAAVFAEGRLRLLDERLVTTLGGRLDRISFGVDAMEVWNGVSAANQERFVVFNPSFGARYTAPAGYHVRGGGGRAFVTPTPFQVAGSVVSPHPDGGVHITHGNAGLRPESSFTWEAAAGVLLPPAGLDLEVGWFRTHVADRITTHLAFTGDETTPDGEPVLSRTSYVNAEEARMEGVEWRLAFDAGRLPGGAGVLRPFLSGTYLHRATESVGDDERDIRSVAALTAALGVDLAGRRFSSRLAARYVGERVDDDWNVWPAAELRYPAHMVIDWSGEARIGERFRLGITASNLTDEYVYEVRGYPLPGRQLRLLLGVEL